MYICSNCGSYPNPYEVDKKLSNVTGIQYEHMRLCENCFEVVSSCVICRGDILLEQTDSTKQIGTTDSEQAKTPHICHNCRCIFISQTGDDPYPLNITD